MTTTIPCSASFRSDELPIPKRGVDLDARWIVRRVSALWMSVNDTQTRSALDDTTVASFHR